VTFVVVVVLVVVEVDDIVVIEDQYVRRVGIGIDVCMNAAVVKIRRLRVVVAGR